MDGGLRSGSPAAANCRMLARWRRWPSTCGILMRRMDWPRGGGPLVESRGCGILASLSWRFDCRGWANVGLEFRDYFHFQKPKRSTLNHEQG